MHISNKKCPLNQRNKSGGPFRNKTLWFWWSFINWIKSKNIWDAL